MKILNLYAGLGGNRKHWQGHEVTAVELDPKIAAVYRRLYPEDTVIEADAHQYLLEHYLEYDFIWTSPPCQTHSRMMKATRHAVVRYSDMSLYQEILLLQHFFKGSYVVENVKPYYKPLIQPQQIGRHCFWSNVNLSGVADVKRPSGFITQSTLEGKQALMDWLGIHYEETIYYGSNHCPCQILRNCVHPALGEAILDAVTTQ